ncbi:MAG: GIY-YIG nuclease family protein [bacterium]|nr:GIY-YIG nuclease family protein [bacterium]
MFYDKSGNILYIGKAKNLKKRLQQYFNPNSVWKQDMLNQAQKIDYLTVQNETEALELEDNLIKKHKPPFNSLLRENHSYVYIKFSKEEFPQITIVKKRKNDGATYI